MVLTLILLGVLCLCDGAFAGFRAFSGRLPHLSRTDRTVRAAWLGVVLSLGSIAVTVAIVGSSVWLSDAPDELLGAYIRGAEQLVFVYGIYATLVLFALMIWTYPNTKARLLASVMVLGPCTLIRPWFIVAGALVAAWSEPRWEVVAACVLVVTCQLGAEALLNRIHERRMAVFLALVRKQARLPR